ncbi:MAG: quinolinate synthase NadA [Ignavibacteriales bacterium]|nr:quinolinate synthase NadA [Ignavibacteriales bacterium]
MNMVSPNEIIDEIQRLKRENSAVILAHNYQIPEVQDIADVVGDSLGLSQAAARTEADMIVFCGVHFMAETAAIISPRKKVLIPDLQAGCSLAASVDVESIRKWKANHPDAIVVAYVNTSAAVKAESDYCCTSSNAVNVVNALPHDKEILFLPDMFLGAYVSKMTGRNMHLWQGECHVHVGITPSDVARMRQQKPEAEMLIHPECGCATSTMYYTADGTIPGNHTYILSTEGMARHARESSSDEFLVATEIGILHKLRKENPTKRFFPTNEHASCQYMKMITLEKVLSSLQNKVYEVAVPREIADKARVAIAKMLELV